MEHRTTHILLCSNRRTGRSSMIRRLTETLSVPVYGYRTKTLHTRPDGYHEIYMFPYGEKTPAASEACHIGDCNTRERVIHNEVFNTLGVELLHAKPDGILVMDEIGFMESQAEAFCGAVRLLRGHLAFEESTAYFAEQEGTGNRNLMSFAGCDLIGVVPSEAGPLVRGDTIRALRLPPELC